MTTRPPIDTSEIDVTGDFNPDPSGPTHTEMPMMGQPPTDPTFETDAALLFPWLPAPLQMLYQEQYVEHGDAELAWAFVRQSTIYDEWLPGMKRDDGSLRLPDEQQYFALMEGYADVFKSYGLNPDLFSGRFVDLLIGDVSPDELDRDRIGPVYERVLDASDAILEDYSQRYGLDLTPEAIIAGILDPELGDKIINRQISISEIAGEAAESGYAISDEFIDILYQSGKVADRESADALFQEAAAVQPVLSALARRHADPDDDFDLNEFVQAEVFKDPAQRRRMRRLVAQEKSTFGNIGAQTEYARSGRGGITGLRQS